MTACIFSVLRTFVLFLLKGFDFENSKFVKGGLVKVAAERYISLNPPPPKKKRRKNAKQDIFPPLKMATAVETPFDFMNKILTPPP